MKSMILWCGMQMTTVDPRKNTLMSCCFALSESDGTLLTDMYSAFVFIPLRTGQSCEEWAYRNKLSTSMQQQCFKHVFFDGTLSLLECCTNKTIAVPMHCIDQHIVKIVRGVLESSSMSFSDTVVQLGSSCSNLHREVVRYKFPMLDKLLHHKCLDIYSMEAMMFNSGNLLRFFPPPTPHSVSSSSSLLLSSSSSSDEPLCVTSYISEDQVHRDRNMYIHLLQVCEKCESLVMKDTETLFDEKITGSSNINDDEDQDGDIEDRE